VEARFAFRTRVLDYIWAGLPMILTAGDYLAEWVEQSGVGQAVPPGDVQAWKHGILAMAQDATARTVMKTRLQSRAAEFSWQRVAEPLRRYCANPYKTARVSAVRRRFVPLLSGLYDFAKSFRG
jgi:glycosyltransferase involved in cell wall biosynthesis